MRALILRVLARRLQRLADFVTKQVEAAERAPDGRGTAARSTGGIAAADAARGDDILGAAADVRGPDAVFGEGGRRRGPPAHWVERVRQAAPHLFQESVPPESTPPAVPGHEAPVADEGGLGAAEHPRSWLESVPRRAAGLAALAMGANDQQSAARRSPSRAPKWSPVEPPEARGELDGRGDRAPAGEPGERDAADAASAAGRGAFGWGVAPTGPSRPEPAFPRPTSNRRTARPAPLVLTERRAVARPVEERRRSAELSADAPGLRAGVRSEENGAGQTIPASRASATTPVMSPPSPVGRNVPAQLEWPAHGTEAAPRRAGRVPDLRITPAPSGDDGRRGPGGAEPPPAVLHRSRRAATFPAPARPAHPAASWRVTVPHASLRAQSAAQEFAPIAEAEHPWPALPGAPELLDRHGLSAASTGLGLPPGHTGGDDVAGALRAWERRRRLDREQRGAGA